MKRHHFISGVLALLMLGGFLFSCTSPSQQELQAKLGEMQDVQERVSKMERKVNALTAELDAVMYDISKQKETIGEGVSPEIARKIDSLEAQLSKLQGDLGNQAVQRVTAAASQSASESAAPKVEQASASTSKPAPKVSESKPERQKVSGTYHKVESGESLWSISKKYNVSIANIRKHNNLPSNARLRQGISLFIPSVTQ